MDVMKIRSWGKVTGSIGHAILYRANWKEVVFGDTGAKIFFKNEGQTMKTDLLDEHSRKKSFPAVS